MYSDAVGRQLLLVDGASSLMPLLLIVSSLLFAFHFPLDSFPAQSGGEIYPVYSYRLNSSSLGILEYCIIVCQCALVFRRQIVQLHCSLFRFHFPYLYLLVLALLAFSCLFRTPHLSEQDVMPPNQTESLSRHLPNLPHQVVFGENAKGTAKAALEQSEKRKARQLSVYIVSTNNDQLLRLGTLWSGVPCRLFKMDGNDFYTEDQGRYAGMGADRLATLRGAAEAHGYPALVFDGGTATTYAAADERGNIIGGGIGPGIAIKLKALGDHTGLPHIDINEVVERAKQKHPIPIFATDTKDAIVGRVLCEMSQAGRSVIKGWLAKVGVHKSRKNDKIYRGMKQNKERAVVITGGGE